MSYLTYNAGTVVFHRLTQQRLDPDTTPDLWATYQQWLAAGNQPFNCDVSAPPPLNREQLGYSDARMARIGEDVMNALIVKGILSLSDLPAAAQVELMSRRLWRSQLSQD